MAYDEKLATRVRKALSGESKVEEKKMMGGLTFMVDGKMCVGVFKSELMCRIDPDVREEALKKNGCRQMELTGRPMKGFVLVDSNGLNTTKDFEYWINLSLQFNKIVKISRKK